VLVLQVPLPVMSLRVQSLENKQHVVVGEAEQAAGVVKQGRGKLAENKARKGAMRMLTIGDKLEGEGMMIGLVLTSVS
jgi:hypothetical protein